MLQTWIERDGVLFGARADGQGPLGGGAGYGRIVTGGTYCVGDIRELLAALARATAGEIVYLDPAAEIDVTDRVFVEEGFCLRVPAGVTLAGNRGQDGAPGPLLCSDAFQTKPLLAVEGPDARITGLRLRGPDPHRRLEFHHRVFYEDGGGGHEAYYRFPNSDGIQARGAGLEVDNCEISAWSHGGVVTVAGAGHRVHHNFIHHCQRMGLGYGVCVTKETQAWIAYNVFQDNKHHIAGPGHPGSGYEACHNVVLPDTAPNLKLDGTGPYGQDHLFDMHGGRDRKDGTNVAGTLLHIHHNAFLAPHAPIVIRGVPEEEAQIHHNWFPHRVDAGQAVISDGNTRVGENVYGTG